MIAKENREKLRGTESTEKGTLSAMLFCGLILTEDNGLGRYYSKLPYRARCDGRGIVEHRSIHKRNSTR